MKITLDLDKELLAQALKLYPEKTKDSIVEMGLKELIVTSKRRGGAKLFGSQKNLKALRRIPA